ncbi:NUDIX hydrolase [Tepidiforma sp.]|uniref:NUDIX hydrolase n=1 Tax=Tepidiforma sp. TaxID=2682230 RepID=UPI002ADD5570|nr:NUDIX hydrolase [Tepidiforma sp.]
MSARSFLPIEDVVSAGGIPWRRNHRGEIEIAICGRRADRLWVLPKGTPDPGEPLEETALREVREETGLDVRLGDRLGTIEYWFTANGTRYHKRVHHWLMEPIGGDVANHDHEFDEVRWVTIPEALELLTYEGERGLVRQAAQRLGVDV